jgi:hypothetical protein
MVGDMSDTKTDLVKFEKEIRPLTGGELLHAPADQFSPAEAVAAYAIVKHIEDSVKSRRSELRTRVLEDKAVISNGKETASGGTTTNVRGNKVQRRKSTKKFADENRIRAVLAQKGLDESAGFDSKKVTVTQQVVNPSKLINLFETGVITKEEMESFHKESWTLIVQPSEQISSLLEAADERANEERKLLDFSNAPSDL